MTVRIAAAQTLEFREDIEAALACAADFAARAEAEGAALLCFPEGFLQGYLTEDVAARFLASSAAVTRSTGQFPSPTSFSVPAKLRT